MKKITAFDDVDVLKGKTPNEVKQMYKTLSKAYESMKNGAYCHCCAEFKPKSDFYKSEKWGSNVLPICKQCVKQVIIPTDTGTGIKYENIDTLKKGLKLIDLPFIDSIYESAQEMVKNNSDPTKVMYVNEQYLGILQRNANYRTMSFEQSSDTTQNLSEYGLTKEQLKDTIARFGRGYSTEDYKFLYEQYKDWSTRYECNTKSMEIVLQSIAETQLKIRKANQDDLPTKDLYKTLQELMNSGNLTPKQNVLDAFSEAQTFGTLIQKWETERPCPDIDPELKDVDRIGQYIDVFYRGHMCENLKIKNPLSHLYRRFIEKYTVKKPEYEGESDTEIAFDNIFGHDLEE